MLNRIYTRSEEAIWKQKEPLRVPKSYRQEALALASKEYIESLRCYSEVRRLLAAGEKPRDVALFIQQLNERPAYFMILSKFNLGRSLCCCIKIAITRCFSLVTIYRSTYYYDSQL